MIGIIGSFCSDRESASGQAVRTTILYHTLCERYGKQAIYCVNTHGFRKHPIRVLVKTMGCVIRCQDIITMAHENGRKFFFPLLYYTSKIGKHRVYHNVIGGSFAEYLEQNPKLIRYAKGFTLHWVQMQTQMERLAKIGVTNTELLPNTKYIQLTDAAQLQPYQDEVYRFCMCSRISVAKGTQEAIGAIEAINRAAGKTIVTLDIYGNPDAEYAETFQAIMQRTSKAITYCGFIPNEKTVEQLRGYYMLLFPSVYAGEGFPGTVWDAFAAGVPIIATNWRYNAEIITDGETGLIYDYTKKALLKERILYAMAHPLEVDQMRYQCLAEIGAYTPDKVFPIVYQHFDDEYIQGV